MRSSDVACYPTQTSAGVIQNGPPIAIQRMSSASVAAVMASATTASGTLKVQWSNDVPPGGAGLLSGNFQPTNWNDIPGAVATISSNGQTGIPAFALAYYFIRTVWTPDGSQQGGTIAAQVHSIGVTA